MLRAETALSSCPRFPGTAVSQAPLYLRDTTARFYAVTLDCASTTGMVESTGMVVLREPLAVQDMNSLSSMMSLQH